MLEDQMNEMFDKRRELGIDKRYECKFQILHKYSPRVITWIIAYGYVNLLSRIIKIVESKSRFIGTTGSVNDDISKDISEVVFGTSLELQSGADVNVSFGKYNISILAYSCFFGNENAVDSLVKGGANINAPMANFGSAHFTSYFGNLHLVKYLIKNGADVNNYDKNGRSPLHYAIVGGNLEIVKCLIKSNANVNFCDIDVKSPLNYASYKGHLEIVNCLLNCGADVNCGASCLSAACSSGQYDVVELLIDKIDINRVDDFCDPPLHSAASSGHVDIVKNLIEHGADVNLLCSCGNPLYCATQNGHLHIIEYLMEHGANVNQGYCGDKNTSLLCCASSRGYLEIVKELVRYGADINVCDKDGRSPLCLAAREGHVGIVKYLINRAVNVNVCDLRGRSPLYYASARVYGGHLEIVKYLINKVLSINICDRYGKSLLYYASAGGHLDVVQFLINSDADADYDISCLFVACHRGHYNIVEYLVDKVKNISSCDGSGRSPLYYASAEGQLDIVKCLIMNHADVNCGASCLSAASNRGHFDIVEYLSDKANVNEIQGYSDPPLHSAASSGHLDIVKYLVAHGADVNLLSFWNRVPFIVPQRRDSYTLLNIL
ncbi:ankyrin repeat domain-containing protein 50-like [Saccostrea cucullata]|uniref:ankyrin repeat domain-containing protein 50-like n=1 Tax=Saccostrea cuccullata TaxID=36930 RepID=UPI002ED17CAA